MLSNKMSGAGGENGCGGLVVVKQEQQSSLQDYTCKSLDINYSNNTADGCNMLQKVPSLSDLSDPENSLGTYTYNILGYLFWVLFTF